MPPGKTIAGFLLSSWASAFLGTVLFFTVLYFATASIALFFSNYLFPRLRIGQPVQPQKVLRQQIIREVRLSLTSILVFGLLSIVMQQAYIRGWIAINWTVNPYTLPVEILVLFVWNELHFYANHWLLHRKWLFRRVHYLHHRSHVPTPFSTYSFHWLEALLLGNVMLLALLMYDFQFLALLSLPVISLMLNGLGHWNYDLFPGKTSRHLLKFSHRHSAHHQSVHGNFGFMLPYFDQLFRTQLHDKSK